MLCAIFTYNLILKDKSAEACFGMGLLAFCEGFAEVIMLLRILNG